MSGGFLTFPNKLRKPGRRTKQGLIQIDFLQNVNELKHAQRLYADAVDILGGDMMHEKFAPAAFNFFSGQHILC